MIVPTINLSQNDGREKSMIDFENSKFLKLRQTDEVKGIDELLIDGEHLISCYKTVRDHVAFTNKRVIAVNVQGVTGKKRDYTSLPYAKIQVYSIETSGVLDIDSELQLWFSTLGVIKFEFTGRSDVVEIGKAISQYILE